MHYGNETLSHTLWQRKSARSEPLAVGDDVESEVRLFVHRSADELVGLRSTLPGFLHTIFHAGVLRVATYNGADEGRHNSLHSVFDSPAVRRCAGLINACRPCFFRRAGRKTDLANRAGTVLMR